MAVDAAATCRTCNRAMAESRSVLLVADIFEYQDLRSSAFAADMPTQAEVETIASWLHDAGYDVSVSPRVVDFVDHCPPHHVDIVLPLWRAGDSRNRTAVVPSVCEARGIPYVGADTFGQVVCQDKALSKALLRAAGLKTPHGVVWRRVEEIAESGLTLLVGWPVVVKPLYSACSIGVDDRSLCSSKEEAGDKARELFERRLGPVICEEYVPGDEMSLCILEEQGRIIERCVAVYRDDAGRCPFHNRLLTFDAKIKDSPLWRIECAPHDSVHRDTWNGVSALVSSLGKLDLCRIDGRLHEDEFWVIELTPDIHLGLDSLFIGGFTAAGRRPSDIMAQMIEVSLRNQGLEVATS